MIASTVATRPAVGVAWTCKCVAAELRELRLRPSVQAGADGTWREHATLGNVAPAGTLFDVDVPDGFRYRPDFISIHEEAELVDNTARVEFAPFEMRGVVARRRVAFFGRSYDAGSPGETPPLPDFLLPLREKVAHWANVDADAFAMALINDTLLVRRSAGTATHRSTTSWPASRYCPRVECGYVRTCAPAHVRSRRAVVAPRRMRSCSRVARPIS